MPSEHRLHPTSILFALAGSLKAFLLPALFLIFTTRRASNTPPPPEGFGPERWMPWWPGDFQIANWQFWILLFLIPSTILALFRYFSFRIRYEGTELVIRTGVFFRNERHIPYARIQNLDAVRNVVHRLLGVAEVRVETGGGEAPEATISVLHETVFEEMRRRIFERRAQVMPAADAQPDAEDTPPQAVESRTLLHLPLRELFLNGVLENRGMILIAAAYGVLWEAGLFNAFWNRLASSVYGPGLIRDTAEGLIKGELPSVARLGVFLVGIVGLLALVRLLSMIWSGVRLHEFRLSRVGDDLRTEYGLLTRVTATIPLRRVQTLTIREAPLQRLFERMSVNVDTAGGHSGPEQAQGQGQGSKRPREPLAPIIRRDAVPALLREVLPTVDLDALDWQSLHPRAFRRALKPAMLLAIVLSVPFLFWFGWRGIVVLPVLVAWLGFMTRKHVQYMHWAATEDVVVFRSGWWWRNVTIAPIAKIQTVSCSESPFDRRAVMARLSVDTAGGRLHQISIPYLARETANALFQRLSARAAETAFRW
jgi:putative membrane protein